MKRNMTKKLNNILCSLALLASVLLLPFGATAEDDLSACIKPAEHDAVTFLLIDRSDKLEQVKNLEDSLKAVHQMMKPSERLIVAVSTDKGSDTRILIDSVKPKKSLWVSKLKIRAAEKKFDECFEKMKSKVMVQDESYNSSAILETLSFVSKALKADKSANKRLIIFSDMIQNSSAVSFYKIKNFDADAQLKKVEKEYLVFDLPNTSVQVAGVGTGITDKRARAIEHFWKKYFEKTGASLDYFGPILLVG